ncbi:MAG: 2-C-methyl-D-erythritol 2,4-cyclodiphosphate synthase [Desulfotomaculaceae bacterium]
MRVGVGYDVHRLTPGRALVLGGVTIPYKKGLLGHSDADVLTHAIMDALLGAAGAGDIGRHFPDSDSQYKDISSMILLARVKGLLSEKGLKVVNIDTVIIAQEPRLASYMENMAANVAAALEIGTSQVNIKATTTEGLGFTGGGDGIAAYAIAMIE